MSYQWKPDSLLCIYVWAILRGKLRETNIPVDRVAAGETKLGNLDYFTIVSNDPILLSNQAEKMANIFTDHILAEKIFLTAEEKYSLTQLTDDHLKEGLKEIFKNGDKTLKDIAEYLDERFVALDEQTVIED
ncbi:hypothetical protein ACPV5L_20190 [Vibrio astriarenae]